MTPDNGNTIPLNNPNMPGAVQPGAATPNVGDVSQLLGQLLKSQATQRQQVMLPQQLSPKQTQPNDLGGMLVNPSTIGGPKHNAKVVMAQSVGRALTDVENRKNQEKARDIAYDVARLEAAMNNPTPENLQLANEILTDPKKGKEIREALNLPGNLLGNAGKPDKTPPYIKQARQMIFGQKKQQQQQPQPQGQPQQGAPMSESLGMPAGMAPGGVPMQPQQGGAAVPTPQPQAAPMPQAQPQPQQQPQGPAQPQAIPGPVGRLMSQMPTTLQLSPEAQLEAQAVKDKIRSSADKQIDYLKSLASDDTKWEMVKAIVGQRESDSIRKAVVSEDKIQQMGAVAALQALVRDKTNQRSVGAENYRTQTLQTMATDRDKLKANMDTLKTQAEGVTKQIEAAQKIIANPKTDKKDKDAASTQLKTLNDTATALRTVSEDLRAHYNNMDGLLQSAPNQGGGSSENPADKQMQQILDALTNFNEGY